MTRTATTIKKHLRFDSLRKALSNHLENIEDHRQQGRCEYSLHDAAMSAFACMYFQDPTLSEFQRRVEETKHKNNLKNIFGVNNIPKASQLRDILDAIGSENFSPIFSDLLTRLQRGKQLEEYQVLPGLYSCAIDGVYHHSSEKVHCEKCLTKTHKNGSVTYSHGVLQGAIMHPDKRQVLPVMPEAIANYDGKEKQDCEINAAKRFVKKLKKDHPRLGFIIVGDGLFSKAPMINAVVSQGMHFLFVAKPNDHKHMMEWLSEFSSLPERIFADEKGRQHRYVYKNDVPLNGRKEAPHVNYIYYELTNEKGKVTFKNSWVTDIEINDSNVVQLAKSGRSRWKIENECFNTLKNQGYCLEHNFGHGKENLSHNMYLLTLLAFYFHQVFELSDPAYQLCRKTFVSKTMLWNEFRVVIRYFIFDSWDDVMLKLMSGLGGIPFLSKK